ncbi:histidine phosphatase family protein [Flammeovirgaceae bacterium SG7u.111]|nr:histidine phosphatase family protein [Flammeovirgaceae bacterium SG7u.132]WPO34723.1 histidine phosphatase family protein [Flammeovirgaceae bacterium SG7u.111]
MDKDIYIIRHGETDYNNKRLVQGSGIDSDLNETGVMQAKAFFHHYQEVGFDKIYTSKLKRTHQSVRSFIDESLPWQQLEGLNEISWGHKEGRPLTSKDDEDYANMLIGWRSGDYHRKPKGGESPYEVQERQKKAWKYIMSNEHESKVLVCMHGRAIRILLCFLLGTELKDMDQFEHKNLCLYHLRYSDGRYEILKRSDVEHIKKYQALQVRKVG